MANELDRVRISAAELRAEALNSSNITECVAVEHQNHQVQKQHKKREGKRPDLQRYQPAAGSGRSALDSEEGETPPNHLLPPDSSKLDQSIGNEKKGDAGKVSNRQGCTDCEPSTKKVEESTMKGDGSNNKNCREGSRSQPKGDAFNEEHQEVDKIAKTVKKARKPDREFYQPGTRRNIQGKDLNVGRDQEIPPTRKPEQNPEPQSQLSAKAREGNKDKNIQKQRGIDRAKSGQNVDITSKCSEVNREHQSRDVEKPVLPIDSSVKNITSSAEKMSIKEKDKTKGVGKASGESTYRGRQMTDKEKKGRPTETNDDAKKGEKGNHRTKEVEREKEKKWESRGENESSRRKNNSGRTEKDRNKKVLETDGKVSNKSSETKQSKGRDNRKQVRDRKDSSTSTDAGKQDKAQKDLDRSERHGSSAIAIAGASKRYSRSDIRHSRNRTYSSSSASSVTSQDGPGRGLNPEHNTDRMDYRDGRRSHLQSWTNSRHSSSESLERSDMSERAEERRKRRRRGGEGKKNAENHGEDRNTPKPNKGRGLITVKSYEEKKHLSGQSQSRETQNHKQGLVPRGRGGGILVLPARTDISNSPEIGQRLFSGGLRGGASYRSRGGRGGMRRLWDPNNPDQKPALSNTQPSLHSSLKHPVYLQSGPVHGQLHFLDTDDEVAGSPPIQGEHFQPRQAAAMAYYKFQSSDNPYCYPMATSNLHGPSTPTSHSFPYAYSMAPYQMPQSNGMYASHGAAQFSGSYRGAGYPQSGADSSLNIEETEQQTRGELGRMLRAADAHEVQLSNLLSRDRVSADGLDRMAQLRADLLGLYEQVILTDIEFSDSQNVDQALWKNVFYQVIERFRQLLKDPSYDNTPHIRNMLLTLLDEGAQFFDALLQKVQTVYQFTLEDYMDGMAIRARPLRKTVKYALISAQRCMICQGDIARYREQATDSANYGKARSWYLKAQQIAPKNGRPYNQLALLAIYTKRKLDAVYYYMRSLAASNPILTAKESLMSLFEEAKRKAEQLEQRRRQENEGGSQGPAVRGRRKDEESSRVEIWIRPNGQTATPFNKRGGSESSRDSEQDGELGSLSATDLKKRFILSFLHAHGKLFTKVGMESFPGVASRVIQEFKTLLQHGASLLGSTNILQIITINMFAVHNSQSKGEEGETRSVLQEQSTALGLGMFALLVQRCTELLKEIPAESIQVADGEEEEEKTGEPEGMVRVSAFPLDLRELLPGIKVWSDWMLGHPHQWNPPPCGIDCSPDVWQYLANLCNVLAHVDHEEVLLYKVDSDEGENDEELTVLQLKEDKLLAGFVPLLAAPQEPCYIDKHTDEAIAADCKRVTVLKYFLEALCGQEEPLLAFKGGKYISVATSASNNQSEDARNRQDSLTENEADVILEAESSLSASEEEEEDFDGGGHSGNDIRQLKARHHALTNKLAQRQKRLDKIQAVLQPGGQLELEIRPLFLVPDTNGFIDHLEGLKKVLHCGSYIIVVPLIVITELDGLAKGQDTFGGGLGSRGRSTGSRGNYNSAAHVRAVQDKARLAVAFLEKGFEAREPCLRALTSRGNQLESIAFRSEDTSGQQGNNDDVILSCCLHYCKDKAKDFMPPQKNGTVRLQREVVLLTDDRNLRVKALTRNVPVRDIPSFLSWAKVG
ncbi:telomerase-binding protein EST1A isoform X2 [Oryzias latipes]|uniref:telomerase-binding protein EST1A isoform X2 n=1 Tax=Oryzias latipes TaxID=8090 RepID=UPI0005CBAD06|nr:telomerase-binding protein EST1A isoform X2 [Oryzias latipes]